MAPPTNCQSMSLPPPDVSRKAPAALEKEKWYGNTPRCVYKLIKLENELAETFMLHNFSYFGILESHISICILWEHFTLIMWAWNSQIQWMFQWCINEIPSSWRIHKVPPFQQLQSASVIFTLHPQLVLCDGSTVDPLVLWSAPLDNSLM